MMENVKSGRRFFLKSGGAAVAGVAGAAGAVVIPIHNANAAPPTNLGNTTLPYPHAALAKAQALQVNQAKPFSYPDAHSPCYIIKMGKPVAGGVGPQGDIVAYSAMCTHMGCPVKYDGESRTFKCGCHFSIFDPEHGGQMVCGQATEDLPRILLNYDAKTDAISAIGIDGLLYGRQSNIL
jgi:arsenite oxidase small subunit